MYVYEACILGVELLCSYYLYESRTRSQWIPLCDLSNINSLDHCTVPLDFLVLDTGTPQKVLSRSHSEAQRLLKHTEEQFEIDLWPERIHDLLVDAHLRKERRFRRLQFHPHPGSIIPLLHVLSDTKGPGACFLPEKLPLPSPKTNTHYTPWTFLYQGQPSRRSPICGAGWFGDLTGEVVTGTL
ncbi:hypothetical protein BDR06DRAFT_957767 [Suillus hirtellus]|nr:hypothetical protein BDR06DRAFT_957767 [Suillus hirtellus]